MLERFKKKMTSVQLEIPFYHTAWQELSHTIPRSFDAVLCRGNSLIYIDSWNRERPGEDVLAHMEKALHEFWKILQTGGLLYIDLINKQEYDRPTYPFIEEIGERMLDGKKVKLTWTITHNYATRLRTCQSHLDIDGQDFTSFYYSYLLRPQELMNMLQKTGFSQVEEISIDGEENYAVFLAHK